MLKAVCFDLMDTVLVDPYVEALEAATGQSLDQLHQRRNPSAWRDFELAWIDEAEFARTFFNDGTGLDVATFHRVRRARCTWVAGMREVIADLDGVAQRYVASNYPVWIDELRRRFALDSCFEGVFASNQFGARKPDPVFYERLVAAIGARPDQCLFVDDRPANCEGAEAAGMSAHHFAGSDGLRARLAAEGLLSSH